VIQTLYIDIMADDETANIHKSKNDRQHNDKDNRTNNDLQNIKLKTTDSIAYIIPCSKYKIF
jgi:hypothetical protein